MSAALVEEIARDSADGRAGEYDLAGFNDAWVRALVQGAFAAPMRAKGGFYMSCKFIIGGGKKTRAKYDDELLKHLRRRFARWRSRTIEARARVRCARERTNTSTIRIRI